MNVKPVMLEGAHIRLEPLTMAHLPDLCEAGLDPELWRWIPTIVQTPEEMRSYIEAALRLQDQGVALPFATVKKILAKPLEARDLETSTTIIIGLKSAGHGSPGPGRRHPSTLRQSTSC